MIVYVYLDGRCNQATVCPFLEARFGSYIVWTEVVMFRIQCDVDALQLGYLIGKNSPLSPENKLLIYKTVLKPSWTYGIALWGCTSKSNMSISVIQRYQSKLFLIITNAPRYVTN
jgi:hypothetical protein